MEHNEQLPEISETIEQYENAGDSGQAETSAPENIGEQTAAVIERKLSTGTGESQGLPKITDSQATIKIEGQEFELETVLARDDKLLKTVLQPHFASIENAHITREVAGGKLTVAIVKRAQHKGYEAEIAAAETKEQNSFKILCGEPEEINPAIVLAEELLRQEVAASFTFDNFDEINETLAKARAEIKVVERQFDALVKTPSAASSVVVPIGF